MTLTMAGMLWNFWAGLVVVVVASGLAVMFPGPFLRRVRDAYTALALLLPMEILGYTLGHPFIISVLQAGVFALGVWSLWAGGRQLRRLPLAVPWYAAPLAGFGVAGLITWLELGHHAAMAPLILAASVVIVWLAWVILRQRIAHAGWIAYPMMASALWMASYGTVPLWVGYMGAALFGLGLAVGLLVYALLDLRDRMVSQDDVCQARLTAAQTEAIHYRELLLELAEDRLPDNIKQALHGENRSHGLFRS